MNKTPKNILDLTDLDLQNWVKDQSLPAFRATQIREWLYLHRVNDWAAMSNLPKAMRELLQGNFQLRTMEPVNIADVGDAIKFLFKLYDGQMVETVYMPSEDRATLCISSQVGCAVNCQFCATGRMGFKRHLSPGEIIEQVLQVDERVPKRISNIVFMGMGEPMLNYDAVIAAANRLHDPNAFGIGASKITISTSGIIPGIDRFTDERQPYRLAISLNDVDTARREASMPITRKYTIPALLESARRYTRETGQRITFEYVMIRNYNMSHSDADALIRLTQGINCKINLIPCNSLDPEFPRPTDAEAQAFKERIEARRPAFIRKTRGRRIEAACGMLHNTITQEMETGAL